MSDVIAGRIDLLDPLARGASGALWRAVDLRFEAICAAKVMRQRDGADVLRFVREQSVGAHGPRALGTHPHLLPPYTWVAEDDAVVLAMPLIRGGTLGQSLADHGALHPLLVAELTRQLLDALAAMHEKRWLHRDVKPANLLLQVTGTGPPHLRLADFGIALHEDDARLTETGFVHGTPGFMSPERLRGDGASAAQDVWAAGAVALRGLGVHADLEAGEDPQALLAGALDGSFPELHRTLHAMLERDPSRRPTASAARDALPGPPRDASRWLVTADGDPFEVFDLLDPRPEGSSGRDLPEIPADGPDSLAPRSTSLHERISERAARATPSAAPGSSPSTGTASASGADSEPASAAVPAPAPRPAPTPAPAPAPAPETDADTVPSARPARDEDATPSTSRLGDDGGPTHVAPQAENTSAAPAPQQRTAAPAAPTAAAPHPRRTAAAPHSRRATLRPVIVLAAIAALALVVAIVLGALAMRAGSDGSSGPEDRSSSPASSSAAASSDASSTAPGTPSDTASATEDASAEPVAGRACAWNLEGEKSTTSDGTAVTCTRSGDDTFTWEER